MNLFEQMKNHQYGEVHVRSDAATGLQAIVAIHDSRLGPALGGCRFVHYETEEAAFFDALRLARGMSYKAAVAGLGHGGGKSVLIKPKGSFDRKALFTAFGKFVNDLGGRYITAEDSGTTIEDMEIIRSQTKSVTGIDAKHGGSGDPSPYTALGTRRGIEACVKHKLGKDSLAGIHVAVLGIGHVGYYLCKELHTLGAKLTVADIDPTKAERAKAEFGATVTTIDKIIETPCDVFSPNALGAGLNDDTLPRIKAPIIAGAANNQLLEPRHGDELHKKGVLYAPDYAINAGGLINVAQEVLGYDAAVSREKTMKIFDTILDICERSKTSNVPTYLVSDNLALEKLRAAQA
ncbi:MAG: amino acid dehydrogenase [Polyangiaceae bacterium]|nr:amino acid dehydrogenase [Polyangiaceae bacterium]